MYRNEKRICKSVTFLLSSSWWLLRPPGDVPFFQHSDTCSANCKSYSGPKSGKTLRARVCISGVNASGKRHDPHAILFEADEDDVNVNVVSHLG